MRRKLPKITVDAERFRGYLEYRRSNITEVAKGAGMSREYLYACLEKGEMSLLGALDICEFLDCDIEMPFGKQDRKTLVSLRKKFMNYI